jgi:hypothetical protein
MNARILSFLCAGALLRSEMELERAFVAAGGLLDSVKGRYGEY